MHSSDNSKSLLVSFGVSALGRTSLHIAEPGVKINGEYYRNFLLKEYLLPEIREFSEYYIFQQNGALLLLTKLAILSFSWRPKRQLSYHPVSGPLAVQILILWFTRFGVICNKRFVEEQYKILMIS